MSTAQKPKVYLIGTGGSISFVGDFRTDYINYSYRNHHLTIEQMLENIPEALEVADVLPEQLVNVGSANILPSHWLQLARRINDIFALDAQAAGVAVTHGTATLEETAYFLNLTVKDQRPVVVYRRHAAAHGHGHRRRAQPAGLHPGGRRAPSRQDGEC